MSALTSVRRVVRSSTDGDTWRTNSSWAPCGVHTRSSAAAIPRAIDACISAANSVRSSAGDPTMSTVPSSAWAIRRTSATCQSTPTPRQSHWKRPATAAIAALSCSGVSLWFSPSVRRMACRLVSVPPDGPPTDSNSRPASSSHWPIAVPPSARNCCTAWWAWKRWLASMTTRPGPERTGG